MSLSSSKQAIWQCEQELLQIQKHMNALELKKADVEVQLKRLQKRAVSSPKPKNRIFGFI